MALNTNQSGTQKVVSSQIFLDLGCQRLCPEWTAFKIAFLPWMILLITPKIKVPFLRYVVVLKANLAPEKVYRDSVLNLDSIYIFTEVFVLSVSFLLYFSHTCNIVRL